MKAILMRRIGDPSVLEYTDVPTPQPRDGEVLVKAHTIGVSNPEQKLKPGMTANVSIVAAHRDDTLKIPNSALRFRMPDQTPSAAPKRDASPSASASPGGRRAR